MLSQNPMPSRERLIFALDVPTADEAKAIVGQLGDSVVFYKCGLELCMSGGYFELMDWLRARDKKVFADLKFFDVPNTVGSAVRALRSHHPHFATVHGNDEILRAACREKGDMKILAVTVLTSLDGGDLKTLGFQVDPQQLVYSRAARALEIGCDGVISSGLEVEQIRTRFGNKFLIVVPGIRPIENRVTDDQKRTVDVEDAFRSGADYVVIGRPIRNAPDPRAAAEQIQARIAALFPR